VGLENIIARRMGRKTIGFGSDPQAAAATDQRNKLLQHATVDDVIEFGMIPELVGRLPVLSALHPLSEDDLVHIMTEPKNSLVKQYQKFFQLENAQLDFTPESLREIARIALSKDTGARGLRSVIEGLMFDIMYDLPEQEAGKSFVITPEVVRGETKLSLRDGSRAA
jgi:ATP-dependent Clp protease ATP-binding subunit ClpX